MSESESSSRFQLSLEAKEEDDCFHHGSGGNRVWGDYTRMYVVVVVVVLVVGGGGERVDF